MLSVKKKCVPLQSQSGNKTIADIKLGYGVMVTLQILVLSSWFESGYPNKKMQPKGCIFFM